MSGGFGGGGDHIIVTVSRYLSRAAGGGIAIEGDPVFVVKPERFARKEGSKFEPRLHLVKIAVPVVREIFLHHVGIRTLRVLHKRAPAPAAVDIYGHVPAIQPRHP